MKLKTHRGAAKRFKKTKTGKIKRSSAFHSHILTKKDPKRKRRLRTSKIVTAEAPKISRMLPYD
jgi:large subunit ribosomal protein L35